VTVQVAHFSSLSAVAPLVIYLPATASQNSNSYAPQVEWREAESSDQSK